MANQITTTETRSVLKDMAVKYGMESTNFEKVLRATVVPQGCTPEQFAAFLLVAREYNLNPITKEIYAFPARGGIQPIVGIDGWIKIINSHPNHDGLEITENFDDSGELISVTASLYSKNRNYPTVVTEYLKECRMPTEPWKKSPIRMLRHKAVIQCARYAYGFSGIVDPDEYEKFPGAVKVSDKIDATKDFKPATKLDSFEMMDVKVETLDKTLRLIEETFAEEFETPASESLENGEND
jgi:phage recombination protein Bet